MFKAPPLWMELPQPLCLPCHDGMCPLNVEAKTNLSSFRLLQLSLLKQEKINTHTHIHQNKKQILNVFHIQPLYLKSTRPKSSSLIHESCTVKVIKYHSLCRQVVHCIIFPSFSSSHFSSHLVCDTLPGKM